MAGILTMFFKPGAEIDETGQPVESRSLPVLGTFVEGSALIAGVSPEVTAIFPLDSLRSAVYQEVELEDDGTEEAAGEGAEADGAEGPKLVIPHVGRRSEGGEERSE